VSSNPIHWLRDKRTISPETRTRDAPGARCFV
jgi:hypothetical protein